jgi:uncharacterized protein YgiM (DUF1202 family)
MNLRALAIAALVALAPAAWGEEQAFTNRSTELRDKAANDGKSVATLKEGTSVKVLARSGGWTRVEADGKGGFVNVFHLRFTSTVDTKSTGSNPFSSVTSFLGGGRSSDKATIATTGIRGLSPEDLKNAAPDAAALAKAQSYRSDKPTAERFAREGKLTAVTVDNPQGERR